MSASPVNFSNPTGVSPATSLPSNGSSSKPIASAQAAIQKSPTSASSPKISKTVETFDAQLLQGLQKAGHALPSNAQKPLNNFLAAVYQSFKAGGKDITQVKSAFQALQKALNPSSQKAQPIILNSAKAWAKGHLKDKGWETTELRKFFNSNLVKPEKQIPADSKNGLSTTGKVVLGLTLAAGVSLLVYKYALPYFYPPTDDDKMTSLYSARDASLHNGYRSTYQNLEVLFDEFCKSNPSDCHEDCERGVPPNGMLGYCKDSVKDLITRLIDGRA